jgi:hypothetical protein
MSGDGYLWGGTVAGLVVIAALGVVLALRQRSIRDALAGYIGERPASWMVYGAWFAYAYGVIASVTQAYYAAVQVQALPSAVEFVYGLVGQSLLWFATAFVPAAQLLALLAISVLLMRHLRAPRS